MNTPKKKQKSHAAAGGQQAQQQATVEFITKVLLWGSWQDVCSTWMSICTAVATMGPYVCALVQLHARPGAVHMRSCWLVNTCDWGCMLPLAWLLG
jgi:hypothetical protein